MPSYFPTVPSTPEPEGWDAAHVLQLVNPVTGRWSCPTVTTRNHRCKNVVSQERSIKVSSMINTMSVEDASVIARDHNQELTGLAQTMLCSLHSRSVDSKEKVQGVVALWKNLIKTFTRQQANPQLMHTATKTPIVDYQTTNSLRRRHLDAPPEPKATLPQSQPRNRTTAPGVAPLQHGAPPSYSTTIDRDAVEGVMKKLQDLTLQNAQLRDQNKKLRDDNAQLAEKRDAAAREAKRARGQLEATEKALDVLDQQVDEQFREINALRDREAVQLETISSLQDTLQKTTGAYRRLKQIWTAASVVPKGKV